ncbi:MAG: hypothetical protein WKF78_09525 [Candidatus Limnocylindrales bacterium]
MDGARTRGHPAALAAVARMIRDGATHAILLTGPEGVGKTTLAQDLAAGLCCTADDPAARPCGDCRACRLVFADRHPDVHQLGPEGVGRQIVIGGPGARTRGIRDLVADLAFAPVEGGARVAIVASADRMNEDAQGALLKTLEEPPAGVVIVLCADAEEPILPTIRSRCRRIRLGPVATREIEMILAEHGAADPPLAARLARVTAGRPGLAIRWAGEPEALRARNELHRSLLDLTDARPAERLTSVRVAAGAVSALTAVGSGPVHPGRTQRSSPIQARAMTARWDPRRKAAARARPGRRRRNVDAPRRRSSACGATSPATSPCVDWAWRPTSVDWTCSMRARSSRPRWRHTS